MTTPSQSIFRESAIKRYRQRQEQSVLLRVAPPPAMLFFWTALLLLLGAGIIAWFMLPGFNQLLGQ